MSEINGGKPLSIPNLAKPTQAVQPGVPAAADTVAKKTFYARLDGCTYYTKTGHCCRFENGQYEARGDAEIAELEELVRQPNQHLISDSPLPVHFDPDVKIMKDVGSGGRGIPVQGTVNSLQIGNMTR